MKTILLINLFIISCCVQSMADLVPSSIDNWEIFVLFEKQADGTPLITVVKNEGKHALTNINIKHFEVNISKEIKDFKNEAIIYAAKFRNGKKSSVTTKVSHEFAVKFRMIFKGFEMRSGP